MKEIATDEGRQSSAIGTAAPSSSTSPVAATSPAVASSSPSDVPSRALAGCSVFPWKQNAD